MWEEEKKSDNKIIAEALIQILENQMDIKQHFGLVSSYEECYWDKKIIDDLRNID